MEPDYKPVTDEGIERLLIKALRERGRLNSKEARLLCAPLVPLTGLARPEWLLITNIARKLITKGSLRLCKDDPKYIEIVPGKYKDFNTDEPTEIEGSGD